MVVLDTNVVIERIKKREEIKENITAVTFVEYPKIVYYKKFYGNDSVSRCCGFHVSS